MHASSRTDASLSTNLQPRVSAEAAVSRIYEAAGFTPPRRFVWAGSPSALARLWADRIGPGGRNLKTVLLDEAIASVQRRAASAPGPGAVPSSFLDIPEFGQAGAMPSTAVRTIDSAVVTASRAVAREAAPAWTRLLRRRRSLAFADGGWNPLDHRVQGLSDTIGLARSRGLEQLASRLERLAALAPLVGWIVPHSRVCWLSEPCTKLERDAFGRAHCGTGAAITFPDGWQIHAWKGIVVPDWVIESPSRLTASAIDHPHDVWVRRCMIEIMTPDRFIAEGGADCFTSDEAGRLWRRRWWNRADDSWDSWAAVEVVNGTAESDGSHKRYYLQVPPEVRSAREGVAWTYGLTEQQYMSLERRT